MIMDSLLESVFVPESSLQGSEFPIHLTWNKGKSLKIIIELPANGIIVKEIHNVGKNHLKVDGNLISMDGFEVNGYLGLVFETRIMHESSLLVPLRFIIEDNEGQTESIENKILLFRQNIAIQNTPPRIELKQEPTNVKVTNKVSVRNYGRGTAIVKLRLLEDSDGEIKKPKDIEEFSSKFCSLLTERFEQTKNKFPTYRKTTDDFLHFITDSVCGTYILNKEYEKKPKRRLRD